MILDNKTNFFMFIVQYLDEVLLIRLQTNLRQFSGSFIPISIGSDLKLPHISSLRAKMLISHAYCRYQYVFVFPKTFK